MADSSLVGKVIPLAVAVLLLTISTRGQQNEVFQVSSECLACHNSLTTPSGEDVSIGSDWRGSMMANSARDPYWQASVRREAMDHPVAKAEIEDECTICHMPMSTTLARASGRKGEVFAHLPIARRGSPEGRLAADGVSCTTCHQIADQKLGMRESFTGGYVIDTKASGDSRPIFGRFEVSAGHTTIMRSATGYKPTKGDHVTKSEMCATCHTLYTKALGPAGKVIGTLPEQVPYLEWRHSAFREEQSCQDCHMPAVREPTPLANTLGQPRQDFSRHVFRGGNSFMLRMLNRFRAELGVAATPQELDTGIRRTVAHLQSETARVSVERLLLASGTLDFDVTVTNLAGHKFPTGYPSRRAWLHVSIRDPNGRAVFESGAVTTRGEITGNDNDTDPARYEPHYSEIKEAGQVQIYESVMVDANGAVTTGLLRALRFAKDNRLLPRGFDKVSAEPDIAVTGDATMDSDFAGGGDTVRYSVNVGSASRPLQIDVELLFQSISFRWADNLRNYDAPEPKRFVSYYDSISAASSEVISRATAIAK
jgi:hypothetical protein